MRFPTSRIRLVTAVAGLAAAASALAPLAAHACDDAAPAALGYANLAHSSDVTAAGVPTTLRTTERGTDNTDFSLLCTAQPLAQLSPGKHGPTYWKNVFSVSAEVGMEQEVTEATSSANAHTIGMALYDQVRTCSGHARHAVAIDGGSITWFAVEDGPLLSTVSVIRVGRRVCVVALRPGPTGHARTALLTTLADHLR